MRKTEAFHFLWITDPWGWLDHPSDTTLRLAREAQSLGFANHWASIKSLRYVNGQILMDVFALDASRVDPLDPTTHVKALVLDSKRSLSPSLFKSVQFRMDPPVDATYLHPLQLLAHAIDPKKTELCNPSEALLSSNEKFEALDLGDLMPRSILSCKWDDLLAFGLSQGKVVLKPLDSAQSKGIELLSFENEVEIEKAHFHIENATSGFRRWVMLQQFLPGISKGEQRLWFVDGKLIGYARKMPLKGDFRVNIDRGSPLVKTTLTAAEKKAALRIGKHLKKKCIRLAAVDLIEGKITDYNVTSPGLIVPMEKVTGLNLSRTIVQALAKPNPLLRSKS